MENLGYELNPKAKKTFWRVVKGCCFLPIWGIRNIFSSSSHYRSNEYGAGLGFRPILKASK